MSFSSLTHQIIQLSLLTQIIAAYCQSIPVISGPCTVEVNTKGSALFQANMAIGQGKTVVFFNAGILRILRRFLTRKYGYCLRNSISSVQYLFLSSYLVWFLQGYPLSIEHVWSGCHHRFGCCCHCGGRRRRSAPPHLSTAHSL